MKNFLNFRCNQIPGEHRDWTHLIQYMEQSPELIYIATPKLDVCYINPAFESMYGSGSDHFFDLNHWPDEDVIRKVMTSHQQAYEGESVTYEVSRINDDRIHHLSITNLAVPFNTSEEVVIGVVKDMSSTIQLQDERLRFDSHRRVVSGIEGLALFEFNLSDNQFSTFGSLDSMFGLADDCSNDYSPLLFKQLLHPDDLNTYLEELGKLMIDPETYTRESMVRIFHLKEGQYRSFLVRSHLSSNRKILTCAVIDRTGRHPDEQAKIEQLSHFVEAALMEYDFLTESFRYITPGLFKMMGYDSGQPELDVQFWKELLHPDDVDMIIASREETLAGMAATYVYRVYVQGEIKWVEERREPLFDKHRQVVAYRALLKNITRLHDQEEQITELRTYDPVTGASNRETLTEYLNELLTNKRPITMIGVSFNHHTEVKQTLGFEMADEWRAVTTATLQKLVPEQAMLAQISEDMNCIVIPQSWTDEEARRFGKRVTNLSEHLFSIGNYEIFTTVSVGVCRYPHDGETANDLIKHTVHVTNHAFQQGGPHIELYSSKVDLPSIRRYELTNDLRSAIKNREFYVVYQPKVDAWTGEILGAEALMRWTHPTWGAISPAEFIPLIERSNLYVEVTDFLIEEVCTFLSTLSMKLPVSINVPVQYFYRDDYLCVIHNSLKKWQLTADCLEIEIPESTLLDNRSRMKSVFNALNAYGLSISFDDFGKGYSSLAYVQDYNVQTIKIDRVFAHGIHQNVKSQAIVRSLMFIAKEFGMKVVVEGVEHFDDLAWLRDHGVSIIQGFLFSRPVSDQAFIALLQQKYLVPTEVLPLKERDALIPARMTFSKIKSLAVNLGEAPVLVSQRSSGLLALYTKLYLPPDDFLQFSIQLSNHDAAVLVTITNRTELLNGLYCYDVVYKHDDTIETALQEALRLTPKQIWDTGRIQQFL